MYEVLNSFKWKPIPKFQRKVNNFEKPQNFSKTPKPRFQNMKSMKNERFEAYQEKKILKKLEETFEDQDWSELREFGRENREQSREISSEMRFRSHEEAYIELSVKLDRWGIERCRGSCRGSCWEKYLSTTEVSSKYQATTHQIQVQKLDRSTRCRKAIEEAGAFSIDPPGVEEVLSHILKLVFREEKNTNMNAIQHATQSMIQSTQ